MRPKKNPEKDLNRERALYFALGLLVTLALIYFSFEWNSEVDNMGYDIRESKPLEVFEKDSTVILETEVKN